MADVNVTIVESEAIGVQVTEAEAINIVLSEGNIYYLTGGEDYPIDGGIWT